MTLTRSEALTLNFYEWEHYMRGWEMYDEPIYPEPPFIPFHYCQPHHFSFKDDGKRPTLLGKLGNLLTSKEEQATLEPYQEPSPKALDTVDIGYHAYLITLPKHEEFSPQTTEKLIYALAQTYYPVSFEIIANSENINLQIVCREPDYTYVYSQLQAYFPNLGITESEDAFYNIIQDNSPYAVGNLGLAEEAIRPLATYQKHDLDPYTGLFGILEHLTEDQHVAIQILFQETQYNWAENILASVVTDTGEPFFANAPEMLPLAQEKIEAPLLGVAVRVVAQDITVQASHNLSLDIAHALTVMSDSHFNRLTALSCEKYKEHEGAIDILKRQTRRSGMLLNSKELVNLIHFPQPSIVSEKLLRQNQASHAHKRTPLYTNEEILLGFNTHKGKTKPVTVTHNHRLKHTHIIGATGTGKSTLLTNLIAQDIQQGNGLCVIDPHGDLIDAILHHIPDERIEDVILFDPSDTEHPIGFNILSAHSDIEKEILSSDLVGIFRRLSTSWGDQMNSVLGNTILAFLESTEPATLIDLRRFLLEKEFRNNFLQTVQDPNIQYYWQHEYPLLKSSSIGSILTRLDSFLRPKSIRNMVAQPKSLDFENILDTNKILLVKLSQGLIGGDNSYLLGSFIVTKLQQGAMARQAKSREQRSNFFLYIDEFQNFITPSMSAILSGARKYHVGLIMVHQDMSQLTKYDPELANAVLSNPGTRICFRLGDTDAKRLEDGFTHFTKDDLQNLSTGEAIGRLDNPNQDFNLSIEPIPLPTGEDIYTRIESIKHHSQSIYGTPKKEVEHMLEAMYEALRTKKTINPPLEKGEVKEITKDTPKEVHKEQPIVPAEKEVPTIPEPPPQEPTKDEIQKVIEHKAETQHRSIQNFIKKMAEVRGYIATIEALTPDGKGRVDILLEKGNTTIACEVSVTTPKEWEFQNIQKCIEAGYSMIVSLASEKKTLQKIQEEVQAHIPNATIHYFTPEELITYLDTQSAKEASTETRMKGYRVKVEYNTLSHEETKTKREGIMRTILQSIHKP
jgi:hypothetical protein